MVDGPGAEGGEGVVLLWSSCVALGLGSRLDADEEEEEAVDISVDAAGWELAQVDGEGEPSLKETAWCVVALPSSIAATATVRESYGCWPWPGWTFLRGEREMRKYKGVDEESKGRDHGRCGASGGV